MPFAGAEEERWILGMVDAQELYRMGEDAGLDMTLLMQSLMNGELREAVEAVADVAAKLGSVLLSDTLALLNAAAVPALVCVLVRSLIRNDSGYKMVSFIAKACVITSLCRIFVDMCALAEGLVEMLLKVTETLTPILVSAISLAGLDAASASLTPMSGICASLIQKGIGEWGIKMSILSAALSAAGSLSERVRLKKLQETNQKLLYWMTGTVVAVFFAVLSLQGRLNAAKDSAAVRTARYAVENMIPVIGGNVSDSLGSLLSAAAVVRNAFGIAGLTLVIVTCAVPVIRLGVMMMELRLFSAVIEPLCEDNLSAATFKFADSVEMLLVSAIGAFTLCAMLTGSCIWASGSALRMVAA